MKYIYFLLFAVTIASCKYFNQDSAIKYNDNIVLLQDKIHIKMTALGNSFSTKDSVEINKNLQALKTTSDSAIAVVGGLSGIDGDTQLKDAALNLFKFYRKLADVEFAQEGAIFCKEEITADDMKVLNDIVESVTKEEKPLDDALGEAQNNLAKKYNFKLEHKDMSNKKD